MDGEQISVDIPDDELMMPHEREMRDALRQMAAILDQQTQVLMVIAQLLNAPKRVIRDERTGKAMGVEPVVTQ